MRKHVVKKGMTLAERLDVLSIPEPNSGCHLWLGPLSKYGYAHLRYQRRTLRANRVAYAVARGPIPTGLFVRDNRACVNPDHLFLGTHADNMRDMLSKQRSGRGRAKSQGERNSQAKLSDDQVRAIKADGRTARSCPGKAPSSSPIPAIMHGSTPP